jgi:hypothetical protein
MQAPCNQSLPPHDESSAQSPPFPVSSGKSRNQLSFSNLPLTVQTLNSRIILRVAISQAIVRRRKQRSRTFTPRDEGPDLGPFV